MQAKHLLLVITFSASIFAMDHNQPISQEKKYAMVIGASSGMGREIARVLAADGYILGLAARRIHLLESLKEQIITPAFIQQMDISDAGSRIERFHELVARMGGLDLLIIAASAFRELSSGIPDDVQIASFLNADVIGFTAIAQAGLTIFEKQGHGHLVGFSSIDSIKGNASCPMYSAAKAYCSRYLQAQRNRCIQKNIPITITELIPGWVNSQEGIDLSKKRGTYWVESLEDASIAIGKAINEKQSVAYITGRWQKVADLLNVMPDDVYNALSARQGGGF